MITAHRPANEYTPAAYLALLLRNDELETALADVIPLLEAVGERLSRDREYITELEGPWIIHTFTGDVEPVWEARERWLRLSRLFGADPNNPPPWQGALREFKRRAAPNPRRGRDHAHKSRWEVIG